MKRLIFYSFLGVLFITSCQEKTPLTINGAPAKLEVWPAGDHSLRVLYRPADFDQRFPENPALSLEKEYGEPVVSLSEVAKHQSESVGEFSIEISSQPLTVGIVNSAGKKIQEFQFLGDSLTFLVDEDPILGMGEGGPRPGRDVEWRELPIEYDRKGRVHKMQPRWQSNAYGSRNPVPLLQGTSGWGVFVSSPWVQVDLTADDKGYFIASMPEKEGKQTVENQHENNGKGLPPASTYVPGLYDFFVFDATDPKHMMADLVEISGQAVMPPKWSLGYMQSHRTLEDEEQIIGIVDSFREKEIPVDAVIYLGTGFCPQGWNTPQPSFDFAPEVFEREPSEVLDDLHDRNVKTVVHIVPWDRDKLPTLQGTIPPADGEEVGPGHILPYWKEHVGLVEAGIDGYWPDEGDWFNLFERIKRHQLYYQGPLSTTANERPWSLHRNGYLGVSKWGGWVWSGDTQSAWKTLEGQIAVGINHSLSLSPYWGSDIGGFYPNPEKDGEMYARWFQFGAFCPSFRSHGRTWFTALPWGFGLSEMGPMEVNNRNDITRGNYKRSIPEPSSLNDYRIEPVTKKYAELRYQLMPYTYTLGWEARETGMPFMRALWLHYPEDDAVKGIGDEYLWGRDMLIAPIYEKGVTERSVYLPEGNWYDWWDNTLYGGSQEIKKTVDLATMPIYVRQGAIIPIDPIRQYTAQEVDEPTTIRIYSGADGAYTLYEDDGNTLDYLEGELSLTEFRWEDASQKLTIKPASNTGSFESAGSRTFTVELIPGNIKKQVSYDGAEVSVSF